MAIVPWVLFAPKSGDDWVGNTSYDTVAKSCVRVQSRQVNEARRYWHRKSRNLGGRPRIDAALRALIRQMSIENVLWGAPRIRGELLKLGFAVAQSTVARYMARSDGRGPSAQRW